MMVAEPTPKRGDSVIFPAGLRVKIESVSTHLVWFIGCNPIPVDDLKPSGEQDTWVYKGDTSVVSAKAGK
jgi:hypothetical protein